MYERIVRQMAFMGRESPGTAVVSSALCKSSDRTFPWQSRCSKRWLANRELRAMSFELQTRSLKLLRRNPLRANIRPQHLRDDDAPVGLLIILHNRGPGPADGPS